MIEAVPHARSLLIGRQCARLGNRQRPALGNGQAQLPGGRVICAREDKADRSIGFKTSVTESWDHGPQPLQVPQLADLSDQIQQD
jgi:hypothetical protein